MPTFTSSGGLSPASGIPAFLPAISERTSPIGLDRVRQALIAENEETLAISRHLGEILARLSREDRS